MGTLEGKVAIVTGASRGIGAAAAVRFAAEGARVVLAARNRAALDAIAAEIRAAGGESQAVVLDVTDEGSVKRAVEAAVERFGRLDVAFNNAGAGQMPQPLADIGVEAFDFTIATNLRGVFLCMKHEIPAMLAAGGGAIVNMSSTAGVSVATGIAAYAAAKHGVIGLTKTAALDYAEKGIRVNALAPGPILTKPEMERAGIGQYVPMKRMGKPDEVAAAAAWLCSDESSYITGAVLAIDGGRLARSG
jgi:NAD(P)-dependent dehydrogenase (short-subunit alcohol dehydrogenase family)